MDRHVESTAGVAGGKPRIAGRRITVQDIAIWHERLGRSVDEIAADYDLSPAQIHAALAYYLDHCEEIDRAIRQGNEVVHALKGTIPSKLPPKS